MTSTIICFFTLKFSIGTSRKGDEDRDWKHSTSSCRQKPLSRLIFKRRTDAANRELDVNQRWLTGQGHFRGQSDFNWGRCPSGPTPRSAPVYTYCVGHRERWIACTAVDSSDTPWHFTARRTKFHCRLSPKCKWIICVRNMVFWKWNERGENRFKASSIFSPDAMGGLWGAWPALWVTSARPGWACWVKKTLYYYQLLFIYPCIAKKRRSVSSRLCTAH